MIILFLLTVLWVFLAIVFFHNPSNKDIILVYWVARVVSGMGVLGCIAMWVFLVYDNFKHRKVKNQEM